MSKAMKPLNLKYKDADGVIQDLSLTSHLAWMPKTKYEVGDGVIRYNLLWVCKEAHTSGDDASSFDESKWEQVSAKTEPGPMSDGVIISIDEIVNTPGSGVSIGTRYIVGTAPEAPWSAESANHIAQLMSEGNWTFVQPRPDQVVLVMEEDMLYRYNGSAWVESLDLNQYSVLDGGRA